MKNHLLLLRTWVVVLTIGLIAPLLAPVTAAETDEGANLDVLLEKMGSAQEGLKTMTAHFQQEKVLELLAEPDLSRGLLFYEAPNRILWEYQEPNPTTLLIDDTTLTAYYPDLKKADRVDIEEKRKRYDRYFGLAMSADAPMQEYFEIDLALESGIEGTHLLVMTPKSKKIEKYLSELRLWVDEETYLPRKFQYLEKNGDSTSYELTEVEANPEIPPERFELALPDDVEVTELTGGFKARRQGL